MASNRRAVCRQVRWFVALATLGAVARAEAAESANSTPRSCAFWHNWAPSAADCPSALELRQRIVARLGRDPFVDADQATISILISITRDRGIYRGRLSLRETGSDNHLNRDFEDRSSNCQSLTEAMVLGATLLLEGEPAWNSEIAGQNAGPRVGKSVDQGTTRATPEPEPDATATPSFAPNGARRTVAAPPKTKNQDEGPPNQQGPNARWRSEFALHSLVSTGVVSSDTPAWGVALSGLISPSGAWAMHWGADYQIAPSIQRAQTRYQFSQTAGWIGAAWIHRPNPNWALLLNSGLLLGVTHAAVTTRNPTDPGDHPLVGVRIGGQAALRIIGPLALEAAAQARLPFVRTIYRATGLLEAVWAQPAVGLAAELGLGLAFE